MNVQTKFAGLVKADQKDIILFPGGIPSFEDEREFLLHHFSENTPFYCLQSVKTPALAFITADPFSFFPDYQVELSAQTTESLSIEEETDVSVFTILTVNEPFEQTTANLKGPVVINMVSGRGKQIVLQNPEYHTRHRLQQPSLKKEEG
ncbi:flagellar assembly protein FliW [Alteribacter lacisalsi]|uniref:Flagellar assembly factor FliW n=1 Tax=Alteribacter lacisalsi TaxID=2045244 RepID=A0A2W0H6W7_9BACI|nr:flagellar assembly protein FliW [Alteribacter lacisalsi]PYZ95850.1 flagellar assembly protein FliW [Alteribacter lacisalsi]